MSARREQRRAGRPTPRLRPSLGRQTRRACSGKPQNVYQNPDRRDVRFPARGSRRRQPIELRNDIKSRQHLRSSERRTSEVLVTLSAPAQAHTRVILAVYRGRWDCEGMSRVWSSRWRLWGIAAASGSACASADDASDAVGVNPNSRLPTTPLRPRPASAPRLRCASASAVTRKFSMVAPCRTLGFIRASWRRAR